MKQSAKVTQWNGKMKTLIRTLKVQEIKYAQREGRLCKHPVALTLAGAKAHFEISITNQELVRASDIITIQSPLIPTREVGTNVLEGLIQLRNNQLKGMAIWPESFKSFCSGYRSDKTHTPSVTSNHPLWYKTPEFREEMDYFTNKEPRKLSIVDADLCGIFSEDNGTSIVNLMRNSMLADKGLLFVNHQKGRDGICISFLQNYFQEEGLFDIGSLRDYFDKEITLTLDGKDKWEKAAMFHTVRSTLVPMYYVIEAYKAGYRLEPTRLGEYRDRNKNSGVGVNMLQWFFRFEKLKSKKKSEDRSLSSFVNSLGKLKEEEEDILRYQLDILAKEAYVYDNYVD